MTYEVLINHLTHLVDQKQWAAIIDLRPQIESFAGTARDRAWALHTLGRAYWNLARDAFDYASSIRYARAAAALDQLGGLVPKSLGTRLVTVGRYREGVRVLHEWISRYDEWEPEIQQCLPAVQYTLGYAYRYQGDYQRAAQWYSAAMTGFEEAGDTNWSMLTACALAQVLARMGRPEDARIALVSVPTGTALEAYRLKAVTEILAAEGAHDDALRVGEEASAALAALEDPDPWELAELHLLLGKLQHQAGNLAERDRHLEVVDVVLRQSPRHDLFTQVRLLLDLEKEVAS